ncbi:MAG: type VI secretion system tube protein Hcp [Gemmataceae bacterium]
MSIDAFLELLNDSGNPAIKGECLDREFSDGALQLVDFELQAQGELDAAYAHKLDLERDDKEEKARQDKAKLSLFTFTITKEIDAATPFLFQAFCERWSAKPKDKQQGKFAKARVSVRKAGGTPFTYLQYEFTDVHIYSWELSNKDGDDLPEETVEFCATGYNMLYFPQSTSGRQARTRPFEAGWTFREDRKQGG